MIKSNIQLLCDLGISSWAFTCKKCKHVFTNTQENLYTNVYGSFNHHRPKLELRHGEANFFTWTVECPSAIKRNKRMIQATRNDLKRLGEWKKLPTAATYFVIPFIWNYKTGKANIGWKKSEQQSAQGGRVRTGFEGEGYEVLAIFYIVTGVWVKSSVHALVKVSKSIITFLHFIEKKSYI